MFRTLIHPSSGACDCAVDLPHRSFCSLFVACCSLFFSCVVLLLCYSVVNCVDNCVALLLCYVAVNCVVLVVNCVFLLLIVLFCF